MELVRGLVQYAILAMMVAILGSVVISWLRAAGVRVPYGNPLVRAIEGAGEFMVRPIRRAIPTRAGALDFAPMVALIILSILRGIVARL